MLFADERSFALYVNLLKSRSILKLGFRVFPVTFNVCINEGIFNEMTPDEIQRHRKFANNFKITCRLLLSRPFSWFSCTDLTRARLFWAGWPGSRAVA